MVPVSECRMPILMGDILLVNEKTKMIVVTRRVRIVAYVLFIVYFR